MRISDQSTGASYKTDAGYAFPYGDYFEIAVDGDDLTHIIWGEAASYSGWVEPGIHENYENGSPLRFVSQG